MTIAAALVNIILGMVYTSYGVMTVVDMKRGWKQLGFSHFGAAWIFMAFTCGPHHLDHGLHLWIDGRAGGPLDFASVLIGFPAGVTWFLLRVEAFNGGLGDRAIHGTPRWVSALPTLSAVYLVALGALVAPLLASTMGWHPTLAANMMLVMLYAVIGVVLLKTQLRNHAGHGGWSLSGLSLAFVFPTCGLMHGVQAVYAANGRYAYDVHLSTIDWLAVPAAMYFLWVVWGLYRDAIQDWNRTSHREPVLVG